MARWKLAFFIAALISSNVSARFLSIDPERQTHNPYAYVGNNPISMIDPDGREYTVAVTKLDDGGHEIHITLNAVIINESSKDISQEEMDSIIERIQENFSDVVSGTSKDGELTYKGTLNLEMVRDESEISKEDHVFRLRDPSMFPTAASEGAVGHADKYENFMYLSTQLLIPGASTKRWPDGEKVLLDVGSTAVHEAGHSAGLPHNHEEENIMAKFFHIKRKNVMLSEQLYAIFADIRTGKVNQGKQRSDSDPMKGPNQ